MERYGNGLERAKPVIGIVCWDFSFVLSHGNGTSDMSYDDYDLRVS